MNFRPAMLHAVLLSTALVLLCTNATAQNGMRLLTVDRDTALLTTVDPITGASISTVEITLPGFTVFGATGLAKHPVTEELYALLRVTDGSAAPRRLVRVNPM